MATTKKSTKAKTKTTKTTVTRAAAKGGKADKSIKSTEVVKAVKAPLKKVSIRRDRTGALRQLNLMTAVLSAGLAIMAGVFMNQRSYQLFTGLLTKDELASRANTVFVPAIRSVYDVELRWAVVTIMGLSAIFSLLYLTRLKSRYQASMQTRVHVWRWIEMAIIGALMVEVVALLSGVQDVMTLKLIGGLVAISAVLGWVAEKQNADNPVKPAKSACVLSAISGLLPWLLIGTYALATPLYGMIRNSWFVYALYAVVLGGFIASALNLRNQLRRVRTQADYEVAERNYLLINLLTRVAFATILVVGLIKG